MALHCMQDLVRGRALVSTRRVMMAIEGQPKTQPPHQASARETEVTPGRRPWRMHVSPGKGPKLSEAMEINMSVRCNQHSLVCAETAGAEAGAAAADYQRIPSFLTEETPSPRLTGGRRAPPAKASSSNGGERSAVTPLPDQPNTVH
ncbi:unnamed protein product [Spirodela intermedia]|uniref:Uncharacterized protein n=1 Tax=Spirodela intermedia TaxID=51605 RepID=A0A7I8L2X3_SPIIN|nr:unnamed protein product [Spirodela intermedia]